MRISAPLFSQNASGSITPCLTFSKKSSGQQARWQKKQKDADSTLQNEQRLKFLLSSVACRFMEYGEAYHGASLYGNEKLGYNVGAFAQNLTGYNLCIRECIDLI
jgi:hypothetical protein